MVLAAACGAFPTPAPRGGVPLKRSWRQSTTGSDCFQPLRRGAVFLCIEDRLRDLRNMLVSNPCAAGRCSSATLLGLRSAGDRVFPTPAPRGGVPLPTPWASSPSRWRCFQPLRRGAVFLCSTYLNPRSYYPVSNPCAAGRCSSGRILVVPAAGNQMFPTPAPRGGVPLQQTLTNEIPLSECFQPLRRGAVFLWFNACKPTFVVAGFPTPAPRGGVPLLCVHTPNAYCLPCFQPLRRGAVFLCSSSPRGMGRTT